VVNNLTDRKEIALKGGAIWSHRLILKQLWSQERKIIRECDVVIVGGGLVALAQFSRRRNGRP
jgi:hypothetical protein